MDSMDDTELQAPEAADGAESGEAPPRGSGRRGAILVLVGVVLLLAVVIGVALAPKGRPADGTLPADPKGFAAPAVVLPRLDGNGTLSLADLKGKPVVVNFWASW